MRSGLGSDIHQLRMHNYMKTLICRNKKWKKRIKPQEPPGYEVDTKNNQTIRKECNQCDSISSGDNNQRCTRIQFIWRKRSWSAWNWWGIPQCPHQSGHHVTLFRGCCPPRLTGSIPTLLTLSNFNWCCFLCSSFPTATKFYSFVFLVFFFFVFCSYFKAIKKFSSCKKIVQTLHRKIQNPVKWVKKVRCGNFAEEINNCGATSVATCKIKEKTNDRRNILHSPNQQILIHQRPPFLQNPHVLCWHSRKKGRCSDASVPL